MTTLQELKTKQEVFDYVAPLLLAQGEKSMGTADFYSSAYRGKDGLKCAIGHLIPDDEYAPYLEGKSVTYLLARGLCPKTLKAIADKTTIGFLQSLQGVHDECQPPRWHSECLNVATFYSLDTSKLPSEATPPT